MEKYTVDIDKVLDEFEQSEALEVCQDQQASKCLFSKNNSSYDFGDKLRNEQSENYDVNRQETGSAGLSFQSKNNISCDQSPLKDDYAEDSTNADKLSLESNSFKSLNSDAEGGYFQALNSKDESIQNRVDFKDFSESDAMSIVNTDSDNFDKKNSVSLQRADEHTDNSIKLASKDENVMNGNTCKFVNTLNKESSNSDSISTVFYPTKGDINTLSAIEATTNNNTEVQELKADSIEVLFRETSREEFYEIHTETDDPQKNEDITVVGFTKNLEEPDLSIQEMDDYLNDISDSNNGQDEDSGVSSQEEINGNNLILNNFNSDCKSEKCPEILGLTHDSSNLSFFQCNKQAPELDKELVSNRTFSYTAEAANDEPASLNIHEACESLPSTETSKFEKCIESNFNSKTEKDNLHFLPDVEPMEIQKSSQSLLRDESVNNGNIDVSVEGIEDSIVQTPTPEMKLVFSPNDGTFRSVPFSDRDISNNLLTTNNNFIYDRQCEETIATQCNLSYNSRLQRPTTLNLTCQNVGTTNIVPCTDLSASLQDSAEEVPDSHLLMDTSNMETSEADTLLSKLGTVKPFWIPDSEASNCMHCDVKFTVIKRRHHCRACGKVLCSRCCSQKARLPYLLNKEDRVCQQCIEHLNLMETERDKDSEKGDSPIPSSCGSSPSFSQSSVNSSLPPKVCWRPHPNNPDDYCSTVSPLQQVEELTNRPPPTVMVPVGVLKRDGIRPGGDLTDLTEAVDVIPPSCRHVKRRDKFAIGEEAYLNSCSETPKKKIFNQKSRHKRIVMSDNDGPLPPIILPDDSMDRVYDLSILFSKLQDDAGAPVIFAVTKNLHVWVKITKLECCFGKECWCFTSHGLCTVGQDEVLLLLERFQDEDVVPRDVFKVFNKIYDDASKGVTVGELGHLIFPDGIFGSWEHRGFLFVRPTFQCLSKLVLPSTPYLFAILIQKWEVPWAKVFPLRLMLRLGAECRYYPCSLVSIRFRKPVYFEIGQTIMSLLADLRNFQFTIPFIPGLVVHMEEKKTYVNIPKNRHEKLMKVLNSNNVEHVLALGCNFSPDADSHLVCMQREEGDYQAQAINIEHTTRKVTGASFIVFSEALKSSTGLAAKFKIVEDGLLVEIPQETMVLLHSALRDMRDLTIQCKQVSSSDPEEIVIVQWTSDDRKFNLGVVSPVDKRSLEGTSSLRIHTSTDYAGSNHLIRWTEVFFLDGEKTSNNRRLDAVDPCRLAETVAQAFCMALIPYLDSLAEVKMTKLGLRITLDSKKDMVEYEVGSLGQNLPAMYMNALDNSLIPVLSRITLANQDDPVALELIFYILTK